MEAFGAWLLKKVLEFFFGKAKEAVVDEVNDRKRDADRDKTNAENTEKYENAETREERIDAAEDLLNRNRN